jgi:hypothetical protein
VNQDLKLLVEWSSPWEDFRTAIRPALTRSPAPLAGEAPTGLWPYRGMATAWVLEAVMLVLVIVLPAKFASLNTYQPSAPPTYDVLYFTGEELPRTEDFGGAQAGRSGRAGGQEAFHHSQTIRVSRGNSASDKVVDAPDIKLPVSMDRVKNMLAVKELPGPAPAEGLRPMHAPPVLSKDAIVAPPPEVIEKLTRATPSLRAAVIAPPPSKLPGERERIEGLSTRVIAPPPSDLSQSLKAPMTGLPAAIISPAPDVSHEQNRALVAMSMPIVPPPPRDEQRELPPLTGPVARASNVVPPPVSAPARVTTQNPKLTLPAPAIIAPPPSQVVRDQREVSGVALGDPRRVVPPPVQTRDQIDRRNLQGLIGTTQVVPPPPNLGSGSSSSGLGGGVPNQHGIPGGTLGAHEVIPPPPRLSGSGGLAGTGSEQTPRLGESLIPPPPNASGGGLSGSAHARGMGGNGSLAANVVPPPPTLDSGTSLSGGGAGSRGSGLGGPGDSGSMLAPKSGGGGSGGGKGIVVTGDPGSTVGRPGSGGPASIALSPAGSKEAGFGGGGGGTGIGHGNGPGSGMTGGGPGAAKSGSGKGADPSAHGGISQYPGAGGAGSGTNGQPPMPGVSVQGGNTITLPSFGGGSGNAPNLPGRSSTGSNNQGLDVTVVGTSRSGGGFNYYGLLKGDRTYTKYFDTDAGPVTMWFSDPSSASHPYADFLISPEPMRADLPASLGRPRVVVVCVIERSGVLRDLHVIDSDSQQSATRVMAAMPGWKFRPAFHGNTSVEVTAVIGVNVDTR